MFSSNSRYANLETAVFQAPGDRKIVYVRQRWLPPLPSTVAFEHVFVQGERLDVITAGSLGDPELYWRVCDENAAMRPEDLEEIGRVLKIPYGTGGGA